MRIIRSIKSMQSCSRKLAAEGKSIAVVPTMGFLHKGHLSLISRAVKAADVVVTTIFVNPTQFVEGEDLSAYPRNEKSDLAKIKKTGGHIVFIPKAEDIYPVEFESWVTVDKLTQSLEGASRPTHFRGVTTVVAKLFNIVRPDVAVFGMKDYQQAIVLKRMAVDLNYPVKMIIAPTVREHDGLAMSSRNMHFDDSQRREAVCLYYALKTARAMIRSGELQTGRISREMRSVIRAACPTAEIDYIAFTDSGSLKPVKRIAKGVVCSLAVRVHSVRLIDNMKLA